ncbi:hypothetical protein ACX27_26780 [Nostoc piscinale CENA21]|uniref:Transposase n=1 Tax=Nostoc piscinale CENA21 TaxID=224013 RepID=A0A0M4T0Q9_9NOSO|nr:hypothetical protein ACX27_26780 [Nostoc piscinale CENA21]
MMLNLDQKRELFRRHLLGESIASLARQHNIRPQTIKYWFRSHFNYQRNQHNTLIPVVQEYLRSPGLTKQEKTTIRQWLDDSLYELAAEGKHTTHPATSESTLMFDIARQNKKLISLALLSSKEIENAHDSQSFNHILFSQRARLR